MTEKRKDKKGRILLDGESYEKDRGYVYKYTDLFGNRKTIRSSRLTESDPTPKGHRYKLSLRELEKKIHAELAKGVCCDNMTVMELVDKYELTFNGKKETTKSTHKTVHNILSDEPFSKKQISSIRVFDAKMFFIDLQEQRYGGKGYSSIHNIRGVLRPAFQMAVENDWIVKNPFDFKLDDVINNTSEKRKAITEEQQNRLLEFVKNDKHYRKYYDAIFILFHTGMRISEFCGLTVKDIDLDNGYVSICKQLQRTRDMRYIVVESAKTESGTREIPVTDEVKEAFRRVLSNRKPPKTEHLIDGYADFLFYDKNGMPMVALHWEKYFERIVEKYNKNNRIVMPKVTPHVCRHTYCTNMVLHGMKPERLKYLAGHSEISVTLDYYTHVNKFDAKDELDRLKEEQERKRNNKRIV